jgi:pilus assembly protein FimV
LLELAAADLPTLQVKLASADAWAKAGLTPPASLESMVVTVEPGFAKDSRTLVLRSTQSVNRPVIDVLLEVSSASGATQVQSSFLVLTQANNASAGGTVVVKAGDTLSAIALTHAVPGADLYQMLWALYQANPQAFFSQNMNLLKVGAVLTIPQAETVRAIDTKLAREMYLKHIAAFNARSGAARTASTGPTPQAAAPVASTQAGTVSIPSAPTPATASGDRVRLTSSNTNEQSEDARVAAAKEIAEIQSRVESLQQNIKQLKDTLSQPGSAPQTGTPGATGSAGAAGAAAGATGSTSAAGATGAAGPTGSTSAAGATGTGGATGSTSATGATGAAGPTGSTGAAGATGVAGSAGVTGAPGSVGTSGSAGAAGQAGVAGAQAGAAVAAGTAAPTTTTTTGSAATGGFQATASKLWAGLTGSALGMLTAFLALGGLLVAWLLRRASARREQDENESDDAPRPLNPEAVTAFDEKLKGLDLNLDASATPAKVEPSLAKPT